MVSSRKTATAKRMFERVEARRSAATAESGALAAGTSLSGSADAARVLGVSGSFGLLWIPWFGCGCGAGLQENLRVVREKQRRNAEDAEERRAKYAEL
jgi:hypothetical protein